MKTHLECSEDGRSDVEPQKTLSDRPLDPADILRKQGEECLLVGSSCDLMPVYSTFDDLLPAKTDSTADEILKAAFPDAATSGEVIQ